MWWKNPSQYYRLRVLPPEWFQKKSFGTALVGNHTLRIAGKLARAAGRKKSGEWETQSYRLSKADFAHRGGFLFPITPHAKAWWAKFTAQYGRPRHKSGGDWMVGTGPAAKANPSPPVQAFPTGGTIASIESDLQPIPNPYAAPGPAPRRGVTGISVNPHAYTVISVENPTPRELIARTAWGRPMTYCRAGPYRVQIHQRRMVTGKTDYPVLTYYNEDVLSVDVAPDPRRAARIAAQAHERLKRERKGS